MWFNSPSSRSTSGEAERPWTHQERWSTVGFPSSYVTHICFHFLLRLEFLYGCFVPRFHCRTKQPQRAWEMVLHRAFCWGLLWAEVHKLVSICQTLPDLSCGIFARKLLDGWICLWLGRITLFELGVYVCVRVCVHIFNWEFVFSFKLCAKHSLRCP
jgi:hypothetical protein